MAIQTFVVNDDGAGKRLDIFIGESDEGLSRSQAKKRIDAGEILVNSKEVTPHYVLKPGDVIEIIASKASEETDEEAEDSRTKKISASDLRIIDETPDFIVLNKEEGVLMHPNHDHPHDVGTGTLIDAVIEHCPEVIKVGDDPTRPGIMSRLDKDVSGLVVIAKKQQAFEGLKKQFAEHSVQKTYLALVHGDMPEEEGDIKFRIARSTDKARMSALPESSEDGQAAWTHYEVLKRLKGANLIKLQIMSGRTHQIRVHLFAMQHPVIGDVLYKLKKTERKIKAPRLMLQSVSLSFIDPTTLEKRSYELEPDPSFDNLIQSL